MEHLGYLGGPAPLTQLDLKALAPTALYIGDDYYCCEACKQLEAQGIRPGKDIEIISLANRGIDIGLPPSIGRMEFDHAELGRQAVQMLERLVSGGERSLPPVRLGARFIPARGGTN